MSDIIQVICGELTTSFDNEVMKAVRKVGINVNKEELLKALELADKLVHCGECKYADKCSRNVAMQDTYQMYVKIDFCSYGERKDNE